MSLLERCEHIVIGEYQLRRKRVKHLRLQVSELGVQVTSPLHLSRQEIEDFLHKQQQWIARQKTKFIEKAHRAKQLWPDRFDSGYQLPWRGGSLSLHVQYAQRHWQYIRQEGRLVIQTPHDSYSEAFEALCKQKLINWYKSQAYEYAFQACQNYATLLGREPTSLTIKAQKSRWGSCGIHNQIYINWVLILAPQRVLDYVVLHELCHLFYRSHGIRFWSLVERHMSDYKVQEQYLREHAQVLMAP